MCVCEWVCTYDRCMNGFAHIIGVCVCVGGCGCEWVCTRGVNLYGLSISRMDFCNLHGLTGVRCNPYGYL